jgi:DNA-binding response OmpR family regulator
VQAECAVSKQPPKIVVVDDDAAISELVCTVLEEEGMIALSCPYGTAAYFCIRRARPNLAILDVHMPAVDGVEIFHTMRSTPETAAIPVIFLTANDQILRTRIPDYPAQNAVLLPKPFHVITLAALVKRILEGQPPD